uniref:Cytochrome c oxidase subunit 2 n=1 Tax=Xenos vesparum TaxID=31928 RepID=Q0QJ97_9NEOP|nr:cytochrome oxydase subunit 2 [Xenos vesparum]
MYWNIMDSASIMMNELSNLSDFMNLIMLFLSLWILSIKMMIVNLKFPVKIMHFKSMEFYWSLFPLTIISLMAYPSIYLTYALNFSQNSSLTIKLIGHQWYWSYEYSNLNEKEILSYMNKDCYTPMMKFLEVDNKLILPYKIMIRFLTSSTDVIHSWSIQSLGVKMDAIPGHLNQMNLIIERPGNFYGQCSEICGINHSYMPICMESVNINMFLNYLN